jgi:hypothetical protein
MSNFVLEGSPKTPTVNLSADKGVLELKGRSIPENSIEFYKPIFDWVENYGNSPKPETQVNVVLEYFNTSSSKCILDFFKKLEILNNGGKTKVIRLLFLYHSKWLLSKRFNFLHNMESHPQKGWDFFCPNLNGVFY